MINEFEIDVLEFNTSDHTIMYKNKGEGNTGWNREKFNLFLNSINFDILQ